MKRVLLVCAVLLIGNAPLAVARTRAIFSLQQRRAAAAERAQVDSEKKIREDEEDSERERRRQKSAKNSYKVGVKHALEGNYLEAVEAFKLTIFLDPNNPDVHFGLGHAYSDLGRWAEAIEAFKEATRLNPKDAEAFHKQAIAYVKLGQNQEAIKSFKQAILIKRNWPDARYNLANTFFNLGQFDAAVVYYGEVLHFKPDFADVHNDLGVTYAKLGRHRDAAESFKRAVRYNSDDPFAHSNLGLAYYRLGQQEESLKSFKRALKLAPDDPFILRNADLISSGSSRDGTTAVGERVAVINAEASGGGRAGEQAGNRFTWRGRSTVIREGELKEQGRKGQVTDLAALSPAITPPPVVPSEKRPAETRPTAPAVREQQPLKVNSNATPSSPATNIASQHDAQPNVPAPTLKATPPAATPKPTPVNAAPVNTAPVSTANTAATTTSTTSAKGDGGGNGVRDASPGVINTSSVPLTEVYRVGAGDTLDIRLANAPTSNSTLYTVLTGGLLEYPLTGDPLVVADLTTDEIAARLTAELKRRAVQENPQVMVSVREYASHSVIVSGLVNDPGNKVIRREAVPLYVVIADSQPRPEAGRVLITSHKTGRNAVVDLDDTTAMNMLVHPGDVINVAVQPPQFYYIAGLVNEPGQKEFHSGITLTQAILAAGGISRFAIASVEVGRQSADGFLVVTRYNLKDVKDGKVPDPRLQAGDRIEVNQ